MLSLLFTALIGIGAFHMNLSDVLNCIGYGSVKAFFPILYIITMAMFSYNLMQRTGQMNIIKQLFGLLVISENFARQGQNIPEDGRGGGTPEKFSRVLARSAAIWESSDERGTSRYISPGGVETEQIREENRMLKKEMFDVVGLAVQRDNLIAQTAESKAWDFQNVRQFLTSRVEILEQYELECWKLMNLWDGSVRIPDVIYNRDFAVTDLKSSVEALLGLRELSDDAAYRKILARTGMAMLEKYRKLLPEEKRILSGE